MQVFSAIAGVAAGVAATVWVVARLAVSAQMNSYLAALPMPPTGMGRGRRLILSAAEQSLVNGINRGVVAGAVLAVVVAVAVAWLLSRSLARPLFELETAAEALAEGDLSHRVEAKGPEEVAGLADAFNRMANSLEEAESLRRRMVADVAHELRNPIAALRGQIEGMADGVIAIDAARLESISEDVTHLSALVGDLQVIALADAGQLRYDFAEIDLVSLVAREVERVRHSVPDGVEVNLVGHPGPLIVSADEQRLSEVLRNLLANAARHTASGTITASVEPDGPYVRTTVTDTGEGIAERDLPFIFERFYRADTSRDTHSGGAGLGLAITKRIVEDHGGRVFATSEPGKGTSIGFELRLA
jgi:signal transduction histidine kinase